MDQFLNKITKLKKSNRGSNSNELNESTQMNISSSSSNNNNYKNSEEEDEFFLAVWSPLKAVEDPRPEFHRGELEKLSNQEEEPCSIVGVVYKHVGDINFPTTAPASMRNKKTKRVRFQNLEITESIIEVSEENNEISDSKMKVTESTSVAETDITEKKRLATEESNKQNVIMLQITKAIRLAKPESIEELECQRILLLSELKRQAIIGQLPILSLIEQKPKDILYEVKLKSISLSHKLTISNFDKPDDTFTNYYVCIATSGMTVLSTNVCKDAENMSFDTDLLFNKLLPNFTITLSIYELRYKNLTEKQRESKWLKLKTIFKKKSGDKDSGLDFIASSKFNYVGKCILHRRNVTANLGYFKVIDLSITSKLYNFVAINCEIYS